MDQVKLGIRRLKTGAASFWRLAADPHRLKLCRNIKIHYIMASSCMLIGLTLPLPQPKLRYSNSTVRLESTHRIARPVLYVRGRLFWHD